MPASLLRRRAAVPWHARRLPGRRSFVSSLWQCINQRKTLSLCIPGQCFELALTLCFRYLLTCAHNSTLPAVVFLFRFNEHFGLTKAKNIREYDHPQSPPLHLSLDTHDELRPGKPELGTSHSGSSGIRSGKLHRGFAFFRGKKFDIGGISLINPPP